MCDFISWAFNFYSGEIYNENSNLVLINYTPSWPHNFLFNENILKMYNSIFNLIFPLKTNLTLLNQIWIEKKNIAKKENIVFRLIDSVHAEFVCFLQNLVSFYMFDVVEMKFKIFYDKIKNCEDFEQIINSHEEFLGEVISNSFIKSKKIMRIIFDILFTTRKFYNFVEIFLTNYNCQHTELSIDRNRVVTEEYDELILEELAEEFNPIEMMQLMKGNVKGINNLADRLKKVVKRYLRGEVDSKENRAALVRRILKTLRKIISLPANLKDIVCEEFDPNSLLDDLMTEDLPRLLDLILDHRGDD